MFLLQFSRHLKQCYSVGRCSDESNDHNHFNQDRAEVTNSNLHLTFQCTFSPTLTWMISSKTCNLQCSNEDHMVVWASNKSQPDDKCWICNSYVILHLWRNFFSLISTSWWPSKFLWTNKLLLVIFDVKLLKVHAKISKKLRFTLRIGSASI